MREAKKSRVDVRVSRAVAGVILVVVTLLYMVIAAGAEDPPSWVPATIYKTADETTLVAGEPVQFNIAVANPSPADGVTWDNVQVTDIISPGLQIDLVTVVPAADDVTVTDNTVVVTVNSLPAQASFVVTIDCTLIGPAVAGEVLVNEATVAYDDPLGNPKPPQSAPDPPEITVHGRYFMPIVFRK